MIRQRIIVAHESDAIREAALRVVRELGHEAIGVADGDSARALMFSTPTPAALVLDVALPRVASYQLVDELRAKKLPVAVILIASVYSRTAYKRRPTSLHGADDYVEQHHVPDQLGGKVARLLGGNLDPHEQPGESEDIRRAGEGRLSFRYSTREEAIVRARKLADVVVADLLLYSGPDVDRARTRGELEAALGDGLQACREYLSLRVPAEIAAIQDFVAGALDAYLARPSSSPGDAVGEDPRNRDER